MTKSNTTSSLDLARIGNLADMIRGIVAPFTIAAKDNKAAGEAQNAARSEEVSVREAIMIELADFSQRQQLTENEVSAVAAKAAAQHNDTETAKAMSTFIGECKRAMHPTARARVPVLTALRDLCWTSETEMKKADSDSATPLRDAWKRQYHMLLGLFGGVIEGAVLDTAEDVLRFTDEKLDEMRTDVKAVMKKITKLTAELQGYYTTFSVDDLGAAIQSLNELDEKTLRRSLAAPMASVTTLPVAATVAVVTPTDPAAPSPTVVKDEGEGEPAAGAVDMFDDLLLTKLDLAA